MKMLLALGLLLPLVANAQACFPNVKLVNPEYVGQDFMEGRDNVIKGDWKAIWCPVGTFDGPVMKYRLYTHVVLDKYKSIDLTTALDLLKQVVAAPEPLIALNGVINSLQFIPPAATVERYQYETLHQIACQQAVNVRRQKYPTIQVDCKAPTPLPLATWSVAPLTSGQRPSRAVVDGKLVIQVAPIYVPVGTPCNPGLDPVFTTTSGSWMAVTGQATNLRWLCKKATL